LISSDSLISKRPHLSGCYQNGSAQWDPEVSKASLSAKMPIF